MCWCTPNIRTPCCGKPECHPRDKAEHNAANTEIDALRARVAELEAEADMTRKGDRWWSPLRLRDCRQDERIKVLNVTYQVLVGHMGTAAAEEAIARINKLTSAE